MTWPSLAHGGSRRLLQVLLLGSALCASGWASHLGPPPRIGYLVLSPLGTDPSPERKRFLRRLGELGYIDGETIEILYRSAEWKLEALDELARELVAAKVDAIVAVTSEAAQAARRATTTIPIIFTPAIDPVADGLVRNLARPGGNITGVSLYAPGLGAKRLDLLKEAFPEVARVALLWNADNPSLGHQRQATLDTAAALGIVLQGYPVSGADQWAEAFDAMARDPPDALIVLADSRSVSYRGIVAEFALARGLPSMFGLRSFVAAGGLMSYGPSLPSLFAQTAGYVDKVLRGVKAGDLPVAQPMRFELVVNAGTGKALGRGIASSILLRADEVIP